MKLHVNQTYIGYWYYYYKHQGQMRCQEKSRPKKIPMQRIFYGDQANIESRFIRFCKLQMNLRKELA